jgi:hypothetical protein
MFRAEFLFDSKHLEKVHLFVASFRTFNVEIRPVRNASATEESDVESTTANGTMPELVAAQLRKEYGQGTKVARQQIFEIARGLGYAPNSILPTRLIQAKVIKKKARGEFTVLATGNGK